MAEPQGTTVNPAVLQAASGQGQAQPQTQARSTGPTNVTPLEAIGSFIPLIGPLIAGIASNRIRGARQALDLNIDSANSLAESGTLNEQNIKGFGLPKEIIEGLLQKSKARAADPNIKAKRQVIQAALGIMNRPVGIDFTPFPPQVQGEIQARQAQPGAAQPIVPELPQPTREPTGVERLTRLQRTLQTFPGAAAVSPTLQPGVEATLAAQARPGKEDAFFRALNETERLEEQLKQEGLTLQQKSQIRKRLERTATRLNSLSKGKEGFVFSFDPKTGQIVGGTDPEFVRGRLGETETRKQQEILDTAFLLDDAVQRYREVIDVDTVGLTGFFRDIKQSLSGSVGAFSQFLQQELFPSLEEDAKKNATFNTIGFFDPRIPKEQSLVNGLAYMMAKARDRQGRITEPDFQNALRSLQKRGAFLTTPQGIRAALDEIERANIMRARVSADRLIQRKVPLLERTEKLISKDRPVSAEDIQKAFPDATPEDVQEILEQGLTREKLEQARKALEGK